MENTTVSMEQVQQILAGSQRLNEMKWEIDTTIGIVLGFLTKEEVSCFRYGEAICQFATFGPIELKWKITKWKRDHVGIDASLAHSPSDSFVYTTSWQAASIERRYIQSVHQALPEILTNLVRVFPTLTGRFASLAGVATK